MMGDCESSIYEKHCKGEFDKMHKALEKINKRLFEDNGATSFQTRIDRNAQWIKRVSVIGSAIWAVCMLIIAWCIKKLFGE